MSKLIGVQYSTNPKGEKIATLHLAEEFKPYYKDRASGRDCIGRKAESVYVGTCDVSRLRVGMDVKVCYGKAMLLSNGKIYQPVHGVEILPDTKPVQEK